MTVKQGLSSNGITPKALQCDLSVTYCTLAIIIIQSGLAGFVGMISTEWSQNSKDPMWLVSNFNSN